MQKLYTEIYRLPLWSTVAMLGMLLLGWTGVCIYSRKSSADRRLRLGCGGLLILWACVICYMTMLSRSSGKLEIHRELFYQLRMYREGGPRELIRTLWMNVLLFVPGGLLAEALWPGKWPVCICMLLTVLILSAMSVGIETVQYRYALGCVEADDVFCNSLGAMMGAGIHEIARSTARRRNRQR